MNYALVPDCCLNILHVFVMQDALLASIAESEKQTELAARVSSWKQKIEHNLEEQVNKFSFSSMS